MRAIELRRLIRLWAALGLIATLPACSAESPIQEDVGEATQAAAVGSTPGADSVLYQAYLQWRNRGALARSVTSGVGDRLEEYAAKCDIATGIRIPMFSCSNGVSVPGQGTTPRGSSCNRPNVLNGVCDPGSKFQVLVQTADAAAVAHCRKDGLPVAGNSFNDIAVIQYNKKNGAVCFYQALGYDDGPLDGQNVAPPSAGAAAWRWISPTGTEAIGCPGCHDSGGFIRSPYLAQLTTLPHALPNASAGFNNKTTPLAYVGLDYATNKTWSVTAPLPKDANNNPIPCPTGQSCSPCTSCHRLAANNTRTFRKASGYDGTAAMLANVATAATQQSKVAHSAASPIWMRPGQVTYTSEAEKSATEFQKCAQGFANSGFVTPPAGCGFTPLGSNWLGLSPAQIVLAMQVR